MARKKRSILQNRIQLVCASPSLLLGGIVAFVDHFKKGEYNYDRRKKRQDSTGVVATLS